jgi:glycosyltransferase involved in cell wall biosynthesis
VRVLIVSNCYPPHYVGGYEVGCFEVVQALKARGHQVTVLTSSYGLPAPSHDADVYRLLRMTGPPVSTSGVQTVLPLVRSEVQNQLAFDRAWRASRPDVTYIWNLGRIPISVAFRAEQRGRVSYYISDPWLANWKADSWFQWLHQATMSRRARLARAMIRNGLNICQTTVSRGELRLDQVQFCSRFMKEATLRAGVPVGHGQVVHWGIDSQRFSSGGGSHTLPQRLKRLLYVGQVVPHKGVHTAIAAVRRLHDSGLDDVTLTIAGGSVAPEYEQQLRQQVVQLGLTQAVHFIGLKTRETLPAVYNEHGILVFPSCWDEPFAITPLEAMASGLPVVATTTGGSGEIFDHEITALTFPESDSNACADRLRRIITDPLLACRLAEQGCLMIRSRFTLTHMVDQIETSLELLAGASGTTSPS